MNEILIPLTIEPLEEGGYLATSPLWEDLLAQGRTIAETVEIAQDVARKLIESYLEHGDPLPEGLAQAMAELRPPFNVQIPIPVIT
jgi:predicted RNase H-like HicB family nuclease